MPSISGGLDIVIGGMPVECFSVQSINSFIRSPARCRLLLKLDLDSHRFFKSKSLSCCMPQWTARTEVDLQSP